MRNEVVYVGVSVKMNHILGMTLCLPYIGERDANDFRKTWHLIREPLEATWTMQKRRRCDPARWSTLELACSLKVLRTDWA